jgi:fluoroacetyl-CoA thioesterase
MVDLSTLRAGLRGSADLLVGAEHTAPHVGSGRVPVLATPVMINLIEAAALAAVEHLLPSGHQSLGIHLDIRHFAATPVGMRVWASCELTRIDGRTLVFTAEAHDEKEPIGGGSHQRVVVDIARFDQRVQRKLSKVSPG